ncbi:MAG: hypothetical protein CBC31_003400, partial [Verrucomicrobia bacterium TMED71]
LNAWGLEHLQHNFTKQNINGRLFLRLDEEAFKELGCTALEASRLVMYMDQVPPEKIVPQRTSEAILNPACT